MQIKKILKDKFGYKKFRANQEDIIKNIISGKDVFAAMPTGGGKSLCYQIPSIVFEGLSIVVSPLVSLMKDQVDEAAENGIKAAYINSTLTAEEAKNVYADLYRGDIKLLYLSPERLSIDGYFERLKELSVAFFAVDEAHCLSEWGHDFRPDYLNLSKIKKYFPDIPVAAFTATATLKVQKDIIRILKMDDPFIVRASFDRPELFYRVEQKDIVLDQILAFIKDRPGDSGIVYRTSRKDVEKTADYLTKHGIKALPYHAGLSNSVREKNQEKFNRDKINVICATIAFGMGINKLNVRYVVHGDLPKSIEGYYQETGRAGRDGLESQCLLLYGGSDVARVQYHIGNMTDEKEKAKAEENLWRMLGFAKANVCRRKMLLEYFNEDSGNNCGFCDVCTDLVEREDATIDSQKIMSAIIRSGEKFGILHIVDIVCGADTEKIRKFNHEKLKTWGAGKDKSKKWWKSVIEELIMQDALIKDSESYNALKLTQKGSNILYGREKFYVIKKKEKKKTVEELSRQLGIAKYDKDMFQMLKDYRFELAVERNVPPYIIFSDKSLKDMCIIKPVDNSSFLRVTGVGERKLEEYGPLFIPRIKEYLGY
ncbi:MAG: DNA helicase RecQ [Spirochaetales bacterium]|nr:DNA helicase RecQ [Spirochaetales bacterium]